MVTFYKPSKSTKAKKAVTVTFTDLDLQGRAVGKEGGNTYFVEGLMPGEKANVQEINAKGNIITAKYTKIIKASELRIQDDCEYADKCGGCKMSFVPGDMLLNSKIEGIKRLFLKNATVNLDDPAFFEKAESTGYRRACRFAIRGDHNKLYVGFREERSNSLVKVKFCKCLTERINSVIEPLNKLINSFEKKDKLGHIECLDSDGLLGILIRFSEVLNKKDEEKIVSFAQATDTVVSVVEPFYDPKIIDKKRESLKERIVAGDPSKLFVTSGGIRIECMPSSFVQVNKLLNTKMLDRVCSYVEEGKDRVLDLFCGLGNFTFPLTKKAKKVVGVDIVARMVLDARENANEQGIDNISFEIADLEEQFENQKWAKEDYDVVVMDPGRAGAKRATLFLAKKKPNRIIYISCNPLAASRDSQELIKKNYKLSSWGVIDMFPRTAHIEMILVFDLENKKK